MSTRAEIIVDRIFKLCKPRNETRQSAIQKVKRGIQSHPDWDDDKFVETVVNACHEKEEMKHERKWDKRKFGRQQRIRSGYYEGR